MDERDVLIWMAGFFDGEGCVSIGRSWNKTPSGKRRSVGTYSLQLAIAQRHEEPLRRFHSAFGGSMWNYKKYGVTYWRWSINSHRALQALERLLPYLLNKRAIAEVGIRFQIQMTAWNKQYGRTGYPPDVVAGREVFYHQARALNAKSRTNLAEAVHLGPRAVTAQRAG